MHIPIYKYALYYYYYLLSSAVIIIIIVTWEKKSSVKGLCVYKYAYTYRKEGPFA